MKQLSSFALVALALPTLSFAGSQRLDETKFIVSGPDLVAFSVIAQNAVGQGQPATIKVTALNTTKVVVGFWEENSGNMKNTEVKLSKLEPRHTSTREIPFFISEAKVK